MIKFIREKTDGSILKLIKKGDKAKIVPYSGYCVDYPFLKMKDTGDGFKVKIYGKPQEVTKVTLSYSGAFDLYFALGAFLKDDLGYYEVEEYEYFGE